MGVDIYGIKPKVKHQMPERPDTFDSEQDKIAYLQSYEQWEEDNPGVYFRSNWWGWRPILFICNVAIDESKIKIDTRLWGENSGGGLRSQQKCNLLADAIEKIIEQLAMEKDNDVIYTAHGMWVDNTGAFVGEELNRKLNDIHPIGSILYSSIVLEDGGIYSPAHGTSLFHIKEFINFLRNCGGFEIW